MASSLDLTQANDNYLTCTEQLSQCDESPSDQSVI